METFTIILMTMILSSIYIVNVLCLKHLNTNLRNEGVHFTSLSKYVDVAFIVLSPGTVLIAIACIIMNTNITARNNRRSLDGIRNSILAIDYNNNQTASNVSETLRSCRDTFEHTNAIINILNKNVVSSSDDNVEPNKYGL